MRIEKAAMPAEGDVWLLSRRNAIFLAIPFALGGVWTAYLLAILAYAAFSFFIVQRVRHHPSS
jgi:cell division protein FtsX